jgi:hypothetical protein
MPPDYRVLLPADDVDEPAVAVLYHRFAVLRPSEHRHHRGLLEQVLILPFEPFGQRLQFHRSLLKFPFTRPLFADVGHRAHHLDGVAVLEEDDAALRAVGVRSVGPPPSVLVFEPPAAVAALFERLGLVREEPLVVFEHGRPVVRMDSTRQPAEPGFVVVVPQVLDAGDVEVVRPDVDGPEGVARGLRDELVFLLDSVGPAGRPVLFDRVDDSVRQHRVLAATAALLEVVRDARGDGLAGDRLASFRGEGMNGRLACRSRTVSRNSTPVRPAIS